MESEDDPGPPAALRLLKGLEEEVYTGTAQGDVVGLSQRIASEIPGFSTEPDARNVEYTTDPYRDYDVLIDRLMKTRCRLRHYLSDLDSLTLVPGGTLSLEPSDDFQISNPDNPYYVYIRDTYGTRVVTASTHVNVGIEDPEALVRAYRVIRPEASLFLALTASSPFLHGELTGWHSTRWGTFPRTPPEVPFFENHRAFVDWMTAQIAAGAMRNPRHLWLALRPNGPATPHEITRLELRICDRMGAPQMIKAITALFEARIWQVLENPDLDPLSRWSDDELRRLVDRNEDAAARSSLEATVVDWTSGERALAAEQVARYIDRVMPTAEAHGFAAELEPLGEILRDGNPAQRWIRACAAGSTPREVLTEEIRLLNETDRVFDPECVASP